VDACWYALEAMKTKVVLIIGGKDKGNDYEPIKPLVKEKCSGIVYLGADNQKLHDNFDGMGIPVRDTHSMKDCVAACYELESQGRPCCSVRAVLPSTSLRIWRIAGSSLRNWQGIYKS
jgi:UDP-N-acetylmuramoylalanine--D-glutamate ligase